MELLPRKMNKSLTREITGRRQLLHGDKVNTLRTPVAENLTTICHHIWPFIFGEESHRRMFNMIGTVLGEYNANLV